MCGDRACVFLKYARRFIIPRLLQVLALSGPSVEVGVWLGDYSKSVLLKWTTGATHTLIDPYKHYPCPAGGLRDKHCVLSQLFFDGVYQNTSKSMRAAFGERVRMMRDFSVNASAHFSDASLAFAYIDARHDHDAVLEDMAAWWPKVGAGGVIAGHDFTHLPLARAVTHFVRNEAPNARIYVTADHPASWIVEKC